MSAYSECFSGHVMIYNVFALISFLLRTEGGIKRTLKDPQGPKKLKCSNGTIMISAAKEAKKANKRPSKWKRSYP